ncbi:hypothetical protein AK812_SmicGene46406 [Symbiodinium microadriaticum]|uniref:Uncharacterized protein n=1 Tax=Symbiodinium microadriaticum TaxID=2951 RepID=A0A1Q9BU12_SYMMI|nr:hypothetical protein AK812_SmicGene46406 [Symbiodinium microadriaticum]
MQKEERAIAYTAWNGHAFFYKSARAVVECDEAERHRYRRQRQDSSTPEFSEWKLWAEEIGCGHCEACGPSCSQRGTSPRCPSEDSANGPPSVGRRLRDSRALRGRLAGASLEVFLHLLQRRRDNISSRRAALLAEQAVAQLKKLFDTFGNAPD